eukprot:tig00000269_g23732.t1
MAFAAGYRDAYNDYTNTFLMFTLGTLEMVKAIVPAVLLGVYAPDPDATFYDEGAYRRNALIQLCVAAALDCISIIVYVVAIPYVSYWVNFVATVTVGQCIASFFIVIYAEVNPDTGLDVGTALLVTTLVASCVLFLDQIVNYIEKLEVRSTPRGEMRLPFNSHR